MNQAAARILLTALEDEGLRGEPTDYDKPSIGYLTNIGVLTPGKTGEPLHCLTESSGYAFTVTD